MWRVCHVTLNIFWKRSLNKNERLTLHLPIFEVDLVSLSCIKLYKYESKFFQILYIFFPIRAFFHRQWRLKGQQDKGVDLLYSSWPLPTAHKHSEIYLRLYISINQNPSLSYSVFIGLFTKWSNSEIEDSKQIIRFTASVVLYMR